MTCDFKELKHAAMVVEDLDAAVRYFADDMGVGPWKLFNLDNTRFETALYHGQPEDFCCKVAMCDMYGLQLELMQPVSGKSCYMDYLQARGNNMHHVCFTASGCPVELTKKLIEKGNPLIEELKMRDGRTLRVFDAHESLAMNIELVEEGEGNGYQFPAPALYPADGVMKKPPIFDDFVQTCCVVDNAMEFIVKYADDFGIAPWIYMHFNHFLCENVLCYEQPGNNDVLLGNCDQFKTQLEVVEPVERNLSQYQNWLDENGNGLQHIAVMPNYRDYKWDEVWGLLKKIGGIENIRCDIGGNEATIFIDNRKQVGCIFEVYDRDPSFVPQAKWPWYPGK